MLKKIVTILLILSFLVVSVSANEKLDNKLDSKLSKIDDKISDTGDRFLSRIGDLRDKINEDISPEQDGSILVTEDYSKGFGQITFIHYKSKSSNSKISRLLNPYSYNKQCSAYMGIKWPSSSLPINIYLNPTNSQGLSEDFLKNSLTSSLTTWDSKTSRRLSNFPIVDPSTSYGYDGKNSVMFSDSLSDNVIAVNTVWYIPEYRRVLESDIQFNNNFPWGDALTNPSVMDFQNIGTHELGHTFSLGDIYKSECSQVSMFGYGSVGETLKRSLESPDIFMLRKIYGY